MTDRATAYLCLAERRLGSVRALGRAIRHEIWLRNQMAARIRELEVALARCRCWNRNMGGKALAHTNTCKDFAKYLADCGLKWCPPCRAAEVVKEE